MLKFFYLCVPLLNKHRWLKPKAMVRFNSPNSKQLAYMRDNSESVPMYELARKCKLRYSQVKYHLRKMGKTGIRLRADRKPVVSTDTAFFQHDKSYWNY